jgi:hypothetical protein
VLAVAATICAVLTAWADVENAAFVTATPANTNQLQHVLRKNFLIVFNFLSSPASSEHHIRRNSLEISHPEGELR